MTKPNSIGDTVQQTQNRANEPKVLWQWAAVLTIVLAAGASGYFVSAVSPNPAGHNLFGRSMRELFHGLSSRKALHEADSTDSKTQIVFRDFEQTLSWIQDSARNMLPGQQHAVVNFWASWCGPCRSEMPELVAFKERTGRVLLLVSGDNESDVGLADSFLRESGFQGDSSLVKGDQDLFLEKWRNWTENTPAKGWSLSLPATYIVDRAGQPVRLIVGETTSDQLTQIINQLESKAKADR